MLTYRFVLLLAFFLVNGSRLPAQTNDITPHQGITSPIHQANLGRIRFTDKAIAPADLRESDFLARYTFTNRSNLFMTVFMANSLTNFLHPLAPGLGVDSLTQSGNYQFNFYVDNQLIYQTNLHPGAPRPQQKNQETLISKPLVDNEHEGRWWSQSAWNRFMINGGDKALSEGPHLFKLDIRPYINLNEVVVGQPIAVGELPLVVKRKPTFNVAQISLTPPKPYEGFAVATESFDRNRIKLLKGSIEADVFKHITSVIVVKRGKLLIEEYFNGATRNTLHDVRSVGKSFASTLTGLARHDGYLKGENQPLSDFYDLQTFSHYSPEKARITLKELLTMSSSFDGNDEDMDSPGNEEKMYPTGNWVKFALDLPVQPGTSPDQWRYFTAGVVVLGDILDKRVPGDLDRYSREKLFRPLGIRNYKWQYTPQQVVNTAGGIQMNALDFAKYGQLYQNKGKWKGQQLLPVEWVRKTFTPYKAIPGRKEEYYGYLFWNKTYHVGARSYETYYCAGNGGNKIFIFKDQPLVVVVTATAFNTYYAHSQVDRILEDYLLPAVLK